MTEKMLSGFMLNASSKKRDRRLLEIFHTTSLYVGKISR